MIVTIELQRDDGAVVYRQVGNAVDGMKAVFSPVPVIMDDQSTVLHGFTWKPDIDYAKPSPT